MMSLNIDLAKFVYFFLTVYYHWKIHECFLQMSWKLNYSNLESHLEVQLFYSIQHSRMETKEIIMETKNCHVLDFLEKKV